MNENEIRKYMKLVKTGRKDPMKIFLENKDMSDEQVWRLIFEDIIRLLKKRKTLKCGLSEKDVESMKRNFDESIRIRNITNKELINETRERLFKAINKIEKYPSMDYLYPELFS